MTKQPGSARGLRRLGAAEALCEARLGMGRVTVSLPELVTETGLSAIAAKRQVSRLRGKVVRVSPRQPLFLIVAPEHRVIGAPPAGWWLEDYFAWLGRPYYLALQSAASEFGASPQALQVTQVMTDRPIRPIAVGRIRVRFFVKRGIGRTPTLQPVGAPAPLRVSTPEATAYDLVRYATRIGGIERAAETIRPLLPRLRARELTRVLDAEGEPAVAQRLGFVIDASGGTSLADAVRDWLPDRLSPVMLSPASHRRGAVPLVQRWQVLNNARELQV